MIVNALQHINLGSQNSIEQNAVHALRDTKYSALYELSCDVRNGTLTVEGTVANYHLKQIAMHCLKNVTGVEEICDRIVVDF